MPTDLPHHLFIIGAPKAGTTYVHSVLSRFVDVHMSKVKEPGFFWLDHLYARGIENYEREYFSDSRGERWHGEATPWYLYSRSASHRIASYAPDAKFIVCLREPASRAVSMYWDQVRAGHERRPIHEAFSPSSIASEAGVRQEQRYVESGLYAQYLKEWFVLFGQEQFLLLTEAQIRNLNVLCESLAAFLEAEIPRTIDERFLHENPGGVARLPALNRLLARVSANESRAKSWLRSMIPERCTRLLLQEFVRLNQRQNSRPHTPGSLIMTLRDQYAPSVEELRALTGLPVESWQSATR